MSDKKIKFELSYISPAPSSFTLKSVPDREFRLREVSMADQIWMDQTFGDKLDGIFKKAKFVELSRIVFHQLEVEDQKYFSQKTIDFVNEETGETTQAKLGGVKMLQALMVGPNEFTEVIASLMEAIGVSKPVLDQIEEEELKKKALLNQQTGPISSTSSVPSTDGTESVSLA